MLGPLSWPSHLAERKSQPNQCPHEVDTKPSPQTWLSPQPTVRVTLPYTWVCITGADPAAELAPLTVTLHGAAWASPPGPPKADTVNKIKSCCLWKPSRVVAGFCASVNTWNIIHHFRVGSYFTISYVVNMWHSWTGWGDKDHTVSGDAMPQCRSKSRAKVFLPMIQEDLRAQAGILGCPR